MIHDLKQLCLIFIILFLSEFSYAQSVDVEGKLKVTDMENINSENKLVTKRADGTLATRDVNSLPTRSFSSDTSRTLGTDMELAKQLCECGSIPPFLVESMLDAGYSAQDLFDGGVDANDLYKAGVSLSDLYNIGVSSFKALNLPDVTMLQLLNAGYQQSDFYGLSYQGGLIFDVKADGTGLIMTTSDVSSSAWYGCEGTNVPGANFGDGQVNSNQILLYCPFDNIAADICDDLHRSGYSDWYLPSSYEFSLANNRIGVSASGTLYNRLNLTTDSNQKYWFSNNWNANYAIASNSTTLKSEFHRVRAVRKF